MTYVLERWSAAAFNRMFKTNPVNHKALAMPAPPIVELDGHSTVLAVVIILSLGWVLSAPVPRAAAPTRPPPR